MVIINNFRIPEWIWNHSELSPDGEKFADLMELAPYPVKMDTRLKFRVHIITGEVLKQIDQLPNSTAKSANLQMFEENASGTLGVDIDALKTYWANIQKIEITVGNERFRPYMNDLFLAKPVSNNNF